MAIHAFITVRSTSSRLPQKCFLPFGDICVLEHVIKRAQFYNLEPVVCTTNDPEDDRIAGLALRLNIRCFRGATVNKLLRWRDCCRSLSIDMFHSVDADDPFFCGEEVKRSYSLLQSGYDMVAPTPSSSSGGATVGYSLRADIIERVCSDLAPETDTEMMWSFIDRVQGVKKVTMENPDQSVIDVRMTLDYHEDYILLDAIRSIAGNLATRKDIATVLKNNPDLTKINNWRSGEWLENQRNKSI